MKKINTVYFSPTGTTKKVVLQIGKKILEDSNNTFESENVDFTLPKNRENSLSFTKEDIVILGVPVYAGRVPNILLKYLNTIKGNGAVAIPVVVYGNRNYDDALIELKDILELNGFKAVAAGAFIGEHSFSKILAKNRPNTEDMTIIEEFAHKIYKKLITEKNINIVEVKGEKPYRKYYRPKDKNGNPVDIRKVTPKTNSNCTNCKVCVQVCPMGSIDFHDVSKLNGICIKCGACIKKCPKGAKYYDDENYLRHKKELEENFEKPRKIELFV